MEIYNFGSLNLDHVYFVDHFVQPGETMSSTDYQAYCGGKGLNQSIAAARAGASVHHAGLYGDGGELLLNYLRENGVRTEFLKKTNFSQGHTVIQVSSSGENCIILCPGSNFELTRDYINSVFDQIQAPGYLLLQNEVSEVPYLVHEAAKRGYRVVLNASPFDASLLKLDFHDIAWLMINEVEGSQIVGSEDAEVILSSLKSRYPDLGIVLTLGKAGCICVRGEERVEHSIYHVPVVDTTAAGDTFTGYFVAALAGGSSLAEAVDEATAASALTVTKAGAAPSIPVMEEVRSMLTKCQYLEDDN